jgi:hypothetical protein
MLGFFARFWIVRSDCDAINAIAETLRHEPDDWIHHPETVHSYERWSYKAGLITVCLPRRHIKVGASEIRIKWSEIGLLSDAIKAALKWKELQKKGTVNVEDRLAREVILSYIKANAKFLTTVRNPRQLLPANKKNLML